MRTGHANMFSQEPHQDAQPAQSQTALSLPAVTLPKIDRLEGSRQYPCYEEDGLVLVGSPLARPHELDQMVQQARFQDIVLVCSPEMTPQKLSAALADALPGHASHAAALGAEIGEMLRRYAREFGIGELEVHLQRRVSNPQPWHTDGTGIENDRGEYTVNLAMTISGAHGTLAVLNRDLDREGYLQLVGKMDKADETGDKRSFLLWSGLKDQLCDDSLVIELPVGQPFLFTTGRNHGIVHKPSVTGEWRLFLKAREATSRTEAYLRGLGHPDGSVGAEGCVIRDENGWHDRLAG